MRRKIGRKMQTETMQPHNHASKKGEEDFWEKKKLLHASYNVSLTARKSKSGCYGKPFKKMDLWTIK